jgi:capsular polysaccharide export protein
LGQALGARGHRVFKINFNGGDWLYWFGRPAWSYRSTSVDLAPYLADQFRRFGITDQILFGDCRPIHRPAVELAAACGVRTHVVEEGYIRAYWVTLERNGVNGYSSLPKDPDWYRVAGKQVPEYRQGRAFHSTFATRACHDVLYHLAGVYNPLFFPGYRTHAPVNAAAEYLGYVKRLPRLRWHRKKDDDLLARILRQGIPYYLLPLQLSSDAQIRVHSRFADMAEVMEHVLASFAAHAPAGTALIVKNHPLDAGLDNYPLMIRQLEHRYGLEGSIHYMETGNLAELLRHAAGTVTVNSTVGMVALARSCPTIALSNPIYNISGLTFQGPLDAFWAEHERPNGRLFRFFRNTVIHTTQINGGLYSRQGIEMLVANSIPALEADRSLLEEML